MARFNNFELRPEEDGTVKFQPLGHDFQVPSRFAARTDDYVLDIQVDADGSARCVGLILRAPAGEALTSESLRRLPLATLAREAVAEAARLYTPLSPGGEPVFRLTSTPPEAVAAFYEEYVHSRRTPRQGSPLTDEKLRDVARVYREAIKRGDPPTEAVASVEHVARSTAARWVRKARDRKLLGPAMQGRGGEAS